MFQHIIPSIVILAALTSVTWGQSQTSFLTSHCADCHNADLKEAGFDLGSFKGQPPNAESFAQWVKIYDKVASGEMPPKEKPRPPESDSNAFTNWLKTTLIDVEGKRLGANPRTPMRRLTRGEYENTMRDLFEMPGILLKDDLPADGSVYGYDKNSDALDISHVNMAKYIEAADHVLDLAIITQPAPPAVKTQRISLACEASPLGACILEGDGVMLKNKQPNPIYPPAGRHNHNNYGAHLALGLHTDVSPGTSVGLFRHEDSSFKPSFAEFVAIYPGIYRIRTSLWSFIWNKGTVQPIDRVQTARIDVWHITGDGRGTDHPSTVLGYFDAPPIHEQNYEIVRWLNIADTFGFNYCNSQIGHEIRGSKERLMGFTGPGIACDGLEIEGPIYEQWPPVSHRRLFGDLPLVEFKADQNPAVRPPTHPPLTQRFNARNHPDPAPHTLKLFTVQSENPQADADRLLGSFLPRAFRRPVSDDVRRAYVSLVEASMKSGDCFETAMRRTYRAALCSPDFLYQVEVDAAPAVAQPDATSSTALDNYSLASRLSYFFWNSMPDDRLVQLAAANRLHQRDVLRDEVERMLKDAKSARFREDFLGQWLKLRKIAANDPDPKLYGGWRPDLQDAMVAETQAYFRELLDQNLGATYLIKSDFAMLNERLAKHYGIPDVEGSKVRRVALPPESPRGPFLTQASILKITANGTTTSPVPRGAFVMDRLLGQPPEPPPANVAAVEPDVRGATTIREQLAKHRDNVVCASCHAKIDPPGFALESFDVIGGFRQRYQSITDQKPIVDPSGALADGRPFKEITEFQSLIAADSERLLKNLAIQFTVYSTGRGISFTDRDAINEIVSKTQSQGGGIRTLIHEIVQSRLFRTR